MTNLPKSLKNIFYVICLFMKWQKKNLLYKCAYTFQTSTNAWYTPRRELDRLNVDSFFPDGVWCHRDVDPETHYVRNYYCQNNLCLPEVLSSDSNTVNDV